MERLDAFLLPFHENQWTFPIKTAELQKLILNYLCESGLTPEQIASTSYVGSHSNGEMLHFIVAGCKYILKNGDGGCLFQKHVLFMVIDCISTCSLPLNSGTLSKLGIIASRVTSKGIHPPEQAGKKSWNMLASPGGCSLKLGGFQLRIWCQVLSSSCCFSSWQYRKDLKINGCSYKGHLCQGYYLSVLKAILICTVLHT